VLSGELGAGSDQHRDAIGQHARQWPEPVKENPRAAKTGRRVARQKGDFGATYSARPEALRAKPPPIDSPPSREPAALVAVPLPGTSEAFGEVQKRVATDRTILPSGVAREV
jgi:hypothetical protein